MLGEAVQRPVKGMAERAGAAYLAAQTGEMDIALCPLLVLSQGPEEQSNSGRTGKATEAEKSREHVLLAYDVLLIPSILLLSIICGDDLITEAEAMVVLALAFPHRTRIVRTHECIPTHDHSLV